MSAHGAVAARVRPHRKGVPADLPARIVLGGAVLAWVAIVLLSVSFAPGGVGAHRHGSGAGVDAATDAAASVDPLSWTWIGAWLLMTAAMMWPLMVPAVDQVSRAVFARWRVLLTASTVLTATVLWLALGLGAALVAHLAGVPSGSVWWQLAFLGIAGLAWGSARRGRLLARCSKLPPIAPRGMRGLRSTVRVGVVSWQRCGVLCGPVMIAMVVGHDPLVMLAASASVWWEAWHPRARRDRVPLALIVVAGLGAIAGGVLRS